MTAIKADEKVRSVAPLNQSPWTREGFLSLRGEGRITGTGRIAVSAGTVSAGFQIGCNTDVTSGVTLGVTAGPTAQMSISWPPALIVGAQASGNISTTLKPGTIADIPFGTKKLAGPTAGLTVDGVHVKVDGCLGPVAVRSYVTVAISHPGQRQHHQRLRPTPLPVTPSPEFQETHRHDHTNHRGAYPVAPLR